MNCSSSYVDDAALAEFALKHLLTPQEPVASLSESTSDLAPMWWALEAAITAAEQECGHRYSSAAVEEVTTPREAGNPFPPEVTASRKAGKQKRQTSPLSGGQFGSRSSSPTVVTDGVSPGNDAKTRKKRKLIRNPNGVVVGRAGAA